MLWLQSWLQQDEQHHPGPRCSDGVLLRDHKMSKYNCDDTPEIVPGCEIKPSTSTTYSNTSFTYFNASTLPTKIFTTTSSSPVRQTTVIPHSHLKPLPEETDYFDPKFIEYHENSSKTVAQNKTLVPEGVMSHFIPGDTPTIYAGSRTKPNITKNQPTPQGSSAFTFFGMPIPSLNLNSFWNSGKSLEKPKKHGRNENWPPAVEPQIQKDGFVPILPGIGGFIPMNITPVGRNSSGFHGLGHATVAKVLQPPSTADEEEFFTELDSPRINRNVSHLDTNFDLPILQPTTTNKTFNNSSDNFHNQTANTVLINEPIFFVSERIHEDSQFHKLSDFSVKPGNTMYKALHQSNQKVY